MINDYPHASTLRRAGFGTDMEPITPSDTADLPYRPIGIYVEGGGNISFIGRRGEVRTVAIDDFALLPVSVRRVLATGTTATGIFGII